MGVFPHVDYALHLTRIECKKCELKLKVRCEYAYNAIMQPDSQTQVFSANKNFYAERSRVYGLG